MLSQAGELLLYIQNLLREVLIHAPATSLVRKEATSQVMELVFQRQDLKR
jgi:hypothetical protein